MKHTMKKLLCMAMAIMLLVSAVPVFAMAAEVGDVPDVTPAESRQLSYQLIIDGSKTTGTVYVSDPNTVSLGNALGKICPEYAKYDVTVTDTANTAHAIDEAVAAVPVNLDVVYTLTTVKEYVVVTLTLGGESVSFNQEKGTNLVLSESLLRAHGLQLASGYKIVCWNDNYNPSVQISNGATVRVDENVNYTCTQSRDASITPPSDNGSGSNNGGSNNNGSNNGGSSNGTMNFPATVNFRVNGKVVYQAYVTNQTQLDEAKAHVITVVRNMGYQVTSWNGF